MTGGGFIGCITSFCNGTASGNVKAVLESVSIPNGFVKNYGQWLTAQQQVLTSQVDAAQDELSIVMGTKLAQPGCLPRVYLLALRHATGRFFGLLVLMGLLGLFGLSGPFLRLLGPLLGLLGSVSPARGTLLPFPPHFLAGAPFGSFPEPCLVGPLLCPALFVVVQPHG